MKTILGIFLIISIPFASFCQEDESIYKYYVHYQPACSIGTLDTSWDVSASHRNDLTKYFNKELKIEPTIRGLILAGIYIDSVGSPCCLKLLNYTINSNSNEILDLQLPFCIAKMGKWIPAIKDNKAVNSIVFLEFYINTAEGKLKVSYK